MASCPRIAACPLFAQFAMKSSLRVWQGYYCEGDFARCERFRLASAGGQVPANLLPNGKSLAVPLEHLESKHLQ